jgi:hypothetical protein
VEYDADKIDETVLALLYLSSFQDRQVTRAWKGQNWDVLNRLHDGGWILDPKSKAKSVVLTEEGAQRSKQLFFEMFGKAA